MEQMKGKEGKEMMWCTLKRTVGWKEMGGDSRKERRSRIGVEEEQGQGDSQIAALWVKLEPTNTTHFGGC